MKHELPTSVKQEKHGAEVTCPGCGKKAKREGALGLPAGWIEWFNPLFGKPWSALVCSMKCERVARFRAVAQHAPVT